ncbi:hypothetical protein [Acinetobacter modestus]|uniref:hypothetical protein n=1 Tax=Acinetobacter modestus TaxID=1776740 RepID=UPI0028D5C77A|nr:hypothetical protein [uncultured Acinetobacter sp.]
MNNSMIELKKDFTRPEYSNPVDAMWDFIQENPNLKCLNFDPIQNGVRAFYIVID